MRLLLLLVLVVSIVAGEMAEASCSCQQPVDFALVDSDDDEYRHHHRLHHECQHKGQTPDRHSDCHPQQPFHKHCSCQHHGPYWISISSRNLSPPLVKKTSIEADDDAFMAQTRIDPPFRPPSPLAQRGAFFPAGCGAPFLSPLSIHQ